MPDALPAAFLLTCQGLEPAIQLSGYVSRYPWTIKYLVGLHLSISFRIGPKKNHCQTGKRVISGHGSLMHVGDKLILVQVKHCASGV